MWGSGGTVGKIGFPEVRGGFEPRSAVLWLFREKSEGARQRQKKGDESGNHYNRPGEER